MTGAGIGLFGLASLMCAVAPPIATLVAARGVRGVGAAVDFRAQHPPRRH